MAPDPLQPDQVNWTQYRGGGGYESFYVRANHPDRPLAVWLRYTIFAPAAESGPALGELWAVVFDGETGRHSTAKVEVPLADCRFSRTSFDVQVAGGSLGEDEATGRAGDISWNLRYDGAEPPLYLLPKRLYHGGFPKAKSLVSRPLARFTGHIDVAGRRLDVDGWLGSQNHNWGSRHTDRYAFGQVAGFDNAPDAFLEVATARSRIGPLWTPNLTFVVLRHRGREFALTSLRQSLRAKATLAPQRWSFASADRSAEIRGCIEAAPDAFVVLEYRNPPGGIKYCLNTKLARCEVTIIDRESGTREVLASEHGALFEILDDRRPDGAIGGRGT
jgi:hypothetical protein